MWWSLVVLEDNKTIADTESAYKYIYLVLSIPSYMTTKELENTKKVKKSQLKNIQSCLLRYVNVA